jgi:hypothetical protein
MKIDQDTEKRGELFAKVQRELQSRGWQTVLDDSYRYRGVRGSVDIHASKPDYDTDLFVNIEDRHTPNGDGPAQLAKADTLYEAAKERETRRSFYANVQPDYDDGVARLNWRPRDSLYQDSGGDE